MDLAERQSSKFVKGKMKALLSSMRLADVGCVICDVRCKTFACFFYSTSQIPYVTSDYNVKKAFF
jgi:hypothetical protein